MAMFQLINTLLFIIGVSQILAVNYCDPAICPYQGQHIRCDNNGLFSEDCKGNVTLVDMEPYRNLILKEHHIYRNILAEGELRCFYPAVRMPLLDWDESLSNNAEYNVKTCKFAHDKCRSTPEFPYAGQNIYTVKTRKLNTDLELYIKEAIFLWFEEYLYADHKLMNSFAVTKPQTGHFTLLMNDRCTYLGCALLDNIQPGEELWRNIIFTCNYASTNINNFPSYKAGIPASWCQRTHHIYRSLCSNKNIDANDFYWYYR